MDITAIITLVIVGVLLIMAEVFVPGGIVGTMGVLILLIGIIGGFSVNPLLGFGLLLGALFFGLIGFWLWVKFFPRSPFGKRIILQSDAAEWDGFDKKQSELLGQEGVAKSPLRPSGIANIAGQRIDVVTRGEMIDAGERVRVLEVHGNRIVVVAVASTDSLDSSTQV